MSVIESIERHYKEVTKQMIGLKKNWKKLKHLKKIMREIHYLN